MSIDPRASHFFPPEPAPGSHVPSESSSSMALLEPQVIFGQEPSSFEAESATISIKFNEQSHSNTEPTHIVSALDTFNEIISGCDATRRFQEKPNQCLANNKRNLRCGHTFRSEKEEKTRQLLADLAGLDISVKMQESLDKLVEFAGSAVCFHQRKYIIQKLTSRLRKGKSKISPRTTSTPTDSRIERGQSADSSGSALIMSESVSNSARNEMAGITPAPTLQVNFTYWLRKPQRHALHYLPEYQPYHTREQCPRSVREWVVEQAKKPLSVNRSNFHEGMDGYLYVYWNRASFGIVKIGCTKSTVGVDERLRRWEKDCRHVAEGLYRSPFEVKHVLRLERLIHAEFREHRVSEPKCRGCSKKHIEWFRELDFGFLIQRIEAWTEWIMKEPYEKKTGLWGLKKSFNSTIPQIRAAAAADEIDKSGRGKALIAKQSSPRYNLRPRRAPRSVSE